MVKISSNNELEWQRFYGQTPVEYRHLFRREGGQAGTETEEGVFIISGDYYFHENEFGYQGVVLALNQEGDSLWYRIYEDFYEITSVIATPDSGFVMAGHTIAFDDNESFDIYLAKCDRFGDVEWEQYYVQESNNDLYCAIPTADGGYALGGSTEHGGRQFHLVKVDSVGEFEWSRSYGTDDVGITCWAMDQCADGGYILAGGGGGNEQGYIAYAVRIDEDGEQIWGRIYDQGDSDFFSVLAIDEGFVFAGRGSHFRPRSSDVDYYLVRTNMDGEQLWETVYAGNGTDDCFSVLPQQNGGYALAGWSDSFQRWEDELVGRNFWLLKTGPDPENNSVRLLDPAYPSDITLLPPYPNPFNSATTINFSLNRSSTLSLGIYSLNGQLIEQLTSGKMEAGSSSASFTVGSLPSGVYIAQVQSEGKTAATKLVLLK